MKNMFMLFISGWTAMAVIMYLFYRFQKKSKNATAVDIVWAAGVGCLALTYGITGNGDWSRRILLMVLACFWSFRLAVYLFIRAYGKPEDGRYQMLRSEWSNKAQQKFFYFYQLQAFGTALFSIPFLPVAFSTIPAGQWYDVVAVIIAIGAIAGEAVADWQLEAFRRNPDNQGKTCRKGLWRYSRHPNYFFEWLHWFTYLFLAFGSEMWFLSALGPVVMLVFLYKITGIPYTEQQALASRGEDYKKYQQATSPFIPWMFKKEDL